MLVALMGRVQKILVVVGDIIVAMKQSSEGISYFFE